MCRICIFLSIIFTNTLSGAMILAQECPRSCPEEGKDARGCCVAATAHPGMVAVPGGAFLRGSEPDLDTKDDETPRTRVEVSAFWIDTTEVTVEAYGACVKAGACKAPDTSSERCSDGELGQLSAWNNWIHRAERGAHPINCVDWSQAAAFCAWAGKRLPTEAEWEKAARGADGRTYPWGEEPASCVYASMHGGGAGCGEDRTLPQGASLRAPRLLAPSTWAVTSQSGWQTGTRATRRPLPQTRTVPPGATSV